MVTLSSAPSHRRASPPFAPPRITLPCPRAATMCRPHCRCWRRRAACCYFAAAARRHAHRRRVCWRRCGGARVRTRRWGFSSRTRRTGPPRHPRENAPVRGAAGGAGAARRQARPHRRPRQDRLARAVWHAGDGDRPRLTVEEGRDGVTDVKLRAPPRSLPSLGTLYYAIVYEVTSSRGKKVYLCRYAIARGRRHRAAVSRRPPTRAGRRRRRPRRPSFAPSPRRRGGELIGPKLLCAML